MLTRCKVKHSRRHDRTAVRFFSHAPDMHTGRDIAADRRGGPVVPAALRRDNARRGAIYDARCRNGTTRPWHCVGRCSRWCRKIAILRRTDRATQVSPLRRGMFGRDIAADRRGGRGGAGGGAARRRATMHVGAPFMTPGAGTARPVRGIALGGVRGGAGKLRYCGGPTGRHKCRPYVAGCSSAESRRSSGRHKCRPYGAGCSSAALRRSSGRHKCRPYAEGCSFAALRQAVAVNGRRFLRRGRS